MALRFRKSFKLAPGIRMNLSGSGSSFSFGGRGASIGVGKRGVHANVGLTGTGFSMRQKLSAGDRIQGNDQRPRTTSPALTSMEVSVGVKDDGEIYFLTPAGDPLPDALVAVAKKQHGDAIRALIQNKCDEINAQIDAIGDLHKYTPSPLQRPAYAARDFSSPRPVSPVPKKIGFFAKLFASRAARIGAENEHALQRHQQHVVEWEAQLAAHQSSEMARRRKIEELIYVDPEAMEQQLEDVLGDIAWPRETLVATELIAGGRTVLIDVDLPEIEDMPQNSACAPARGMKLSVKDLSPTQIQKLYMRHVHSIGFRIIGEAFTALPNTETLVLSGYSQRRDKGTGQENDEYLYSVRVQRAEWQRLSFDQAGLSSVDPVEALTQFAFRRSMTKTGVFKAISPFSVADL